METRNVTLLSIVTSLYAVGVIFLATISYSLVQVRIADALIPLSIILGMPGIIGVTLGNIVANIYGGLGYVDIIGGSAANFIAAYVGWKIGSRTFHGSYIVSIIIQNLIVSSIVGTYLALLFNVPLELGFTGIFLGSLISMNVLGYLLVLAIKKYNLI